MRSMAWVIFQLVNGERKEGEREVLNEEEISACMDKMGESFCALMTECTSGQGSARDVADRLDRLMEVEAAEDGSEEPFWDLCDKIMESRNGREQANAVDRVTSMLRDDPELRDCCSRIVDPIVQLLSSKSTKERISALKWISVMSDGHKKNSVILVRRSVLRELEAMLFCIDDEVTEHAVVCVVSLGLYSGRYSRMATEKKDFVSQYVMGVVCLHSEYVTDADAVSWLQKAVSEKNEGERNFVNAVCLLAIMNFEGRGMAKNSQEAIRLFNKAGTGGCVRAMLWMGKIYDKGDGVEQDSAEAVKWYTEAAENGMPWRKTGWGNSTLRGKEWMLIWNGRKSILSWQSNRD